MREKFFFQWKMFFCSVYFHLYEYKKIFYVKLPPTSIFNFFGLTLTLFIQIVPCGTGGTSCTQSLTVTAGNTADTESLFLAPDRGSNLTQEYKRYYSYFYFNFNSLKWKQWQNKLFLGGWGESRWRTKKILKKIQHSKGWYWRETQK